MTLQDRPAHVSSGVSADEQMLAGHRHRRRRRRRVLVTTGTPIAIASRILFCVPRAMRSGATVSAGART